MTPWAPVVHRKHKYMVTDTLRSGGLCPGLSVPPPL